MSKRNHMFGDIEVSDEQLRRAVKANAEGEGEGYVGANDTILDFGKANSFVDESRAEKRFNISITNHSQSDESIVLFPGYKTSFEGKSILTDGNFKTTEGANNTTVVVLSAKSGGTQSIECLKNYIKHNPTRLCRLEVKVDNEEQLDEPFTYRETSPFKSDSEMVRTPSDYIGSDTQNPKAATIDETKGFVLSDTTELEFKLRASRKVNLSFVFGASVDMTKAINKKAEIAADTAAAAILAANR